MSGDCNQTHIYRDQTHIDGSKMTADDYKMIDDEGFISADYEQKA